MRVAIDGCRGCDLYRGATQAVFGEGPASARLVFVGEQPGDQEDREGHPFVGPSGKLLDRALLDAGIERDEAYVTNAVKHFKWRPTAGGKRRLHDKPNRDEIRACFPWLERELRILKPEAIICLGATAAESVFGKKMPVLANRGRWLESPWSETTLITVHPSALLRIPSPDARDEAYARFVEDLRLASQWLDRSARRAA